ncbi:MAG: HIT domain-containing protein [Bacilli bacterium]|nr:HIT domain-containing protein [Bacilli bacterium]
MDCIFCKIINGDIPSYTIYENEYVKCFLDINPIGKAHTLIVPKKHYVDINDIELDVLTKVNEAAKEVVKMINDIFKPSGVKLVQNNGCLQEVKHYHLHIIPEYKGKQNKISVEEVYKKLTK